jgi:radical SAM-linked protein
VQEQTTVEKARHIRTRLRFRKTGTLRFISHHDLMRVFERAIRRAEIPIRMSQGFNPRPKMSFPTALALGIEGVDEVVDLELSHWIVPQKILEHLQGHLPPDLKITSVEPIALKSHSKVEELVYRIEGYPIKQITEKEITGFLTKKEFQVSRDKKGRRKLLNIRSSIVSITQEDDVLLLRLKPAVEGTARPDEVLEALGLRMDVDTPLRITRSAVRLSL